jgi:hypothetical protein
MNRLESNFLKACLALFFITASPLKSYAQDWDDGPDPPPAPIDDYIYPMIFVAIITVLFFFYKKKNKIEETFKQN